jgi:hypothetical protein
LRPVEDHDVLHHCSREKEEIVCGCLKASKQPPSESPLLPQPNYPQGHAEDVVEDCEEPHHGAQVEPRPAEDREERGRHHGRSESNLPHGNLI